MRTPMIAGNWKMNTTVNEAIKLVKALRSGLDKISNVDIVICPPFVSLYIAREMLKGSSIKLGAQNLFYEEKGAFTGEISPLMLTDLCEYVIIGHSERRQYFDETGDIINKKVKAVIDAEMKPILCIGEKLEENEAGRTEEVLTRQLMASSDRLYYLGSMVIAYEPIWAIGTGRASTGEAANKTSGFIRQLISHQFGQNIGSSVRILYGGSVTADNIAEFMGQPEIDGALVGGASLSAEDFQSMVIQTARIRGLT